MGLSMGGENGGKNGVKMPARMRGELLDIAIEMRERET